MALTLEEAAAFLNWKPRTLRKKLKEDPTIPVCKRGKDFKFILSDLEEWVRQGYSDEAKKMLGRPECINAVESTTSALEEYESLLGQGTGKEQKDSNTSSTRRRGTATTG